MRRLAVLVAMMLVTTLPASAQQPMPTNDDKRLDEILTDWSKRMSSLKSFYTQCRRSEKDSLTDKVKVFEGEAMFERPDLAKIDLANTANKADFERLYFKEKHLFLYQPSTKTVEVHEIPKTDPNGENMILAFLKGMALEQTKKRFKVSLEKETEWHAYIRIEPKTDADRQDFTTAQLAIWLKNYNPVGKPDVAWIPARFFYQAPDKKQVTYEFSNMVPNAKLDPADFAPRKPQGWEVKYPQPQAQPEGPKPKNLQPVDPKRLTNPAKP